MIFNQLAKWNKLNRRNSTQLSKACLKEKIFQILSNNLNLGLSRFCIGRIDKDRMKFKIRRATEISKTT